MGLRASLTALAGPALSLVTGPGGLGEPGEVLDEAEIRSQVEDILSDPAYAGTGEPLLERLLGPVYDWFERMVAWMSDNLLRFLGWLLSLLDLAVLAWLGPVILAVVTGVTVLFLARRRAREVERRAAIERILEMGTDPAELEELARQAEREGRHSDVIRLRFVAGLLRLDQADRISFYPGLSNALVSEALGDPAFDELASQFDRVVYGRRPADAAGARRAADGWDAVLGVHR